LGSLLLAHSRADGSRAPVMLIAGQFCSDVCVNLKTFHQHFG